MTRCPPSRSIRRPIVGETSPATNRASENPAMAKLGDQP